MAWTTPKENWVAGDAVTATLLNNMGANFSALKNPASNEISLDQSDLSTTSTSFVDTDGTNLSLTITTTGGDVMVGFIGNFAMSVAAGMHLTVTMDGSAIASDDGIAGWRNLPTTAPGAAISFVRLVTGVSAGSHTFKLRWKIGSGTLTLYSGAGTSSGDLHPQFWVREVS